MLSWIRHNEAWYANGFRIVRDAPQRWVLTEPVAEPESGSLVNFVAPEAEPLATELTLSGAKREAELRTAARSRAKLRRRHIATVLLTVSIAVLGVGESALLNTAIAIAASYLVLRSSAVILGTLFWKAAGGASDIAFYQ